MSLFYQPLISEGIHTLDAEESRHAVKVLRLQPGDVIEVTDGRGKIYTAAIAEIKKNICCFHILTTSQAVQKKFSVQVAIAPTKNMEKMEWFVEKATEIGIDEISFILCQNSERKTVNPERLIKKATSAMRQSRQAWLPQLHPLSPFADVLNFAGQKFIATVGHGDSPHLQQVVKADSDSLVLIGPEGDFSEMELTLAAKKGFQNVTLGPNTLRTETAGIVACHIMNLANY